MVYLILLFVLIAVPLITMVTWSFVVGFVGTVFMGIIRLFGKKEPLPNNPDIFPIIPKKED